MNEEGRYHFLWRHFLWRYFPWHYFLWRHFLWCYFSWRHLLPFLPWRHSPADPPRIHHGFPLLPHSPRSSRVRTRLLYLLFILILACFCSTSRTRLSTISLASSRNWRGSSLLQHQLVYDFREPYLFCAIWVLCGITHSHARNVRALNLSNFWVARYMRPMIVSHWLIIADV